MKPEYNISPKAGTRLGSKHSDDSIARMLLNHKGMLGKTHSAETLVRMSEAKGTTIYVYSSDKSSLIHTFISSRKAGEYFNVSFNTILKYSRNGEIFKDQWILSTTLQEKK